MLDYGRLVMVECQPYAQALPDSPEPIARRWKAAATTLTALPK